MHQPPSTKGITCYVVGTSILYRHLHHMIICMQAELRKRESQIADLQENLKSRQAETSKEKEELTRALSVMEKLKEGYNKEQVDWATEKAALTQRAENVEAALKLVVDELTSVKRKVHAMNVAVFGKPS